MELTATKNTAGTTKYLTKYFNRHLRETNRTREGKENKSRVTNTATIFFSIFIVGNRVSVKTSNSFVPIIMSMLLIHLINETTAAKGTIVHSRHDIKTLSNSQ